MAITFLLFTQDFLLSIEYIVPSSNVIVEYKNSRSFQISGGNCIVKNMLKANLINESIITQYQLEELSSKWEKTTQLFFGLSAKPLMNGFLS